MTLLAAGSTSQGGGLHWLDRPMRYLVLLGSIAGCSTQQETAAPFARPTREACPASPGARPISKAAVLEAVGAAVDPIKSCLSEHNWERDVKLSWEFGCDGKPINVWVMSDDVRDTPLADCLTKSALLIQVPPIEGEPPPRIRFPFKP